MRRTLGTAVFSGMLGVTLFGIFLTPVFFYVIDSMSEWRPFSSGLPSRISRVLMDLLQLRFLRRPLRGLATRLTSEGSRRKPGQNVPAPGGTKSRETAPTANMSVLDGTPSLDAGTGITAAPQ